MKPLDSWRFIDEVTLYDATMLILDIEPHRWNDAEDKFDSEKYEQIFCALNADVLNGKLKNNNPAKPGYTEFDPYIPLEELKSWIVLNNIYAPFFERCRNDEIIYKKDLINLVSLSKFFASHHGITNVEANQHIMNVVIGESVGVYDISGVLLPEQVLEMNAADLVCNVFNQNWWRDPAEESSIMLGYRIAANEVAIRISDAAKHLSIPVNVLNVDAEVKLRTDAPLGQNKLPSENDKSTDIGYISNELALLNRAAFEFWSSADPDDKKTHPINEQVVEWLKYQGYSDISAKRGAVIIRPEWAAKGRR